MDGLLCGALWRPATQRQMDVLAAYVVAGGSIPEARRSDDQRGVRLPWACRLPAFSDGPWPTLRETARWAP